MLRVLTTLLCSIVAGSVTAASTCESEAPWQEWQLAKAALIKDNGRVVDHSDPKLITTSEGQSYALFMALVNNEPKLFRTLLQWTEAHLAAGALDRQLPAWLWGRQSHNQWGVLDQNSAADSDLWIAYTLLEAGRLWHEFEYTRLAHAILHNMARQEVEQLPGLGTLLLPAPFGFVHDGTWRLNPSYLPPQLVTRVAHTLPREPWQSLARDTPEFLMDASPAGIAPDWISWRDNQLQALRPDEQEGSYDAIRVYLWVGMLSPNAELADQLQAHFRTVQNFVDAHGSVAEHIETDAQHHWGVGPPGFSAALLPLFDNTGTGERLRTSLARSNFADQGYYSQMLWLFGQGWAERRFRFDAVGRLVPAWLSCS